MENNDILENGLEQTIIEQNQQIEDLKFDLMVNRIINVCSGIVIVVLCICLYHYIELNDINQDKIDNLEISNEALYNNLLIPKQ